MNRRVAIIAGMAGITAAVVLMPRADAQASEGTNPGFRSDSCAIAGARSSLYQPRPERDHDMSDRKGRDHRAALRPGEVWSEQEEIKVPDTF